MDVESFWRVCLKQGKERGCGSETTMDIAMV